MKPSWNRRLLVTLFLIPFVLTFSTCAKKPKTEILASETSQTTVSPPVIRVITPNRGSVSGGDEITISGSGFQSDSIFKLGGTGDSAIQLNVIRFVSSSVIVGMTPAHEAGPVNVYVINPDNQKYEMSSGFIYANPSPPPSISAVRPNVGPTNGGTLVVVTGANFQIGSKVVFGGVSVVQVSWISQTEMRVITPPHAVGMVNVVVTNPDGGTCVLADAFRYLDSTTTATAPPTTTPPTNKVIFEDNFDNEIAGANPSKWTVAEPAGTDISVDGTVYFGTSGKSAKMQDDSPTEVPIMSKIIGSQTGKFWYEISIRLAQTNQIEGVLYVGNSTAPGGRYGIENLGVSIAFWNDGCIKYNDNVLPWTNVQTYQADKWYTVKVFVDVGTQRFDLYVDNVLKLSNIRFRYPMTSLDTIMVVGRAEFPSSTIWIDNVLVTEAP